MKKSLALLLLTTTSIIYAENRSIDGSSNNLSNPNWGSAGIQQLRTVTPNYLGDGNTPNFFYPNARLVSNTLFHQPGSNPDARGLTTYMVFWGQFLDHDITLTSEGHEFLPVPIPTGDPWFDPMGTGGGIIPFSRSGVAAGTGTGPMNPRQQENLITSFIDASQVYGSDNTAASWLRTNTGGRLESSQSGELLPVASQKASAPFMAGGVTDPFVAGDVRANEVSNLVTMHTLFMREHNRIAQEIETLQPGWSDEQIYQATRKIVGALMQSITYNEYLPSLGVTLDGYSGYDASVQPDVANEFSSGAFRFGHSQVTDTMLLIDSSGNQSSMALSDIFFRPDIITSDLIEDILRGAAVQSAEQIDTGVVSSLRNMLFGPPGAGGLDLAALNIQRGRDHGLADYNSVRMAYGLSKVTAFDQITSDVHLQGKLSTLYGDVDSIDLWVGLLAEDLLSNSSVGETIHAILKDQFERLRDGDRFFYLVDPDFDIGGSLAAMGFGRDYINSRLFSNVILDNTSIASISSNVFVKTPEPATYMMLGFCLSFSMYAREKRKRINIS